jgi:hypothetical protein
MLSRNVLRSVMAPVSRGAAAAAGSRAVHLPSRDAKDSRWGKTADDFERVQKVFKQVPSVPLSTRLSSAFQPGAAKTWPTWIPICCGV